MERALATGITVSAVVGVVLTAALLTSCGSEDDDGNPCGGQPIVYVEQDDDETEYHCGSATGAVIPLVYIDADTRSRAKASPGKAVPFKPVIPPKPAGGSTAKPGGVNTAKAPAPAPKVNTNKQPAPKSGAKR